MLDAEFFAGNRKTLLARVDGSLVIITANGMLQRSGDVTFPFRQDSNFFYLTGLAFVNDAVLVIDGGNEFLILPNRSETEDIFGGSLNCDEIAKISGIKTIYKFHEGWALVKKMRNGRNKISTLSAPPAKVSGIDSFYTNPARRSLTAKLKRVFADIIFEDIRADLMEMRMIKQPSEIAELKHAIEITKVGFAAAQIIIASDAYEYEVEAEFDHVFKKHGAVHGYCPPIIASGASACSLHYCNGVKKLTEGEYVLMDVGAEINNYTADITRVYPVGKVSQRHLDVYEAVLSVHQDAIKILRSGITWKEYVLKVEEIMGTQLIELGLIKEASRKEIRRFFSHGISHSLGLDAHDVCDYKVIQENMVITVEPGIYIPEEGIGIRVEDDILITKDGSINLSKEIPYR